MRILSSLNVPFKYIKYAILGIFTNAGLGAAAGATGAGILVATGHPAYDAQEVAFRGAVGNALLGAALPVGIVMADYCGLEFKNNNKVLIGSTLAILLATEVAGGVIGYELLINVATSTMTLAEMAIDMTVGGAVLIGGVGLGLLCCCAVIQSGLGNAMLKKITYSKDPAIENNPPTIEVIPRATPFTAMLKLFDENNWGDSTKFFSQFEKPEVDQSKKEVLELKI